MVRHWLARCRDRAGECGAFGRERVANALGTGGAASGIYDLAKKIGAPTALEDIGMKEAYIDEAVPLILEVVSEKNPRPVDEAGVRTILEGAFSGRRTGLVPERSI